MAATAAATSSNRRSRNGPVLRSPSAHTSHYLSSTTPSSSSSSAFASSISFSFSSTPTAFFINGHHRSASPTRVNLSTSSPPSSPTFRFSLDRSTSPNRAISVTKQNRHHNPVSFPKKTCMCSPTTHPGSFRCSLHKHHRHGHSSSHSTVSYTPNRLHMMRSAMKNSLVRIGGVEGEWVKRALTALIRPSSHQQRRRADFQPRPSRLSVMSRAGDP